MGRASGIRGYPTTRPVPARVRRRRDGPHLLPVPGNRLLLRNRLLLGNRLPATKLLGPRRRAPKPRSPGPAGPAPAAPGAARPGAHARAAASIGRVVEYRGVNNCGAEDTVLDAPTCLGSPGCAARFGSPGCGGRGGGVERPDVTAWKQIDAQGWLGRRFRIRAS